MARFAILLLSTHLLLLRFYMPSATASVPPGYEETNALGRPRHKIFHPPTNFCLHRQSYQDPLSLAPCGQCDSWNYTPQKFLTIVGTYFCLKAVGPSISAKLSIACDVSDSQWNIISDSHASHISTVLADGTEVCLDVDADHTIVTNPCRSFGKDNKANEADSQWFQFTTFSYGKDWEMV